MPMPTLHRPAVARSLVILASPLVVELRHVIEHARAHRLDTLDLIAVVLELEVIDHGRQTETRARAFLPLVEKESRLELPRDHRYFKGIDTTMSIDQSTHSLFGVSKAAADLLVQEYGRYFDMPTVCFRGGCLTGPQHAGAELHGFLAYLMKCVVTGRPYTVFGYGGKQVRDNIHCADLVSAFMEFQKAPRAAAVYNIGGGRSSNCSMLEAIDSSERIAGRELDWTMSEDNRIGDHRWWISDLAPFMEDYPGWSQRFGIEEILTEIYEYNVAEAA